MKNARNNGQKRVKNCLKWTASGLLLALMFVLVFAGTLSGAFGIENELQQNGIIQSNVASAAYASSSYWDGNTTGTNPTWISVDINDSYQVKNFAKYTPYYGGGTSAQGNTNGVFKGAKNDKHGFSVSWYVSLTDDAFYAMDNGAISSLTFKLRTTAKGEGLFNSHPYQEVRVEKSANAWVNGTYDNSIGYHDSATGTPELKTSTKGEKIGNSYRYILTFAAYRLRSTSDIQSVLKGAWVDMETNDSQAPQMRINDDDSITFYDDLAGISKIEDNGNDITKNASLVWSENHKEVTYKVTSGKHKFVVTDNVGNKSEEYIYNMLETDADGNYLLTSRDDFDLLSTYVAKGKNCAGKSYKIVPDTTIEGQDATTIAMGSSAFTPIGNSTTKFAGTLLGNGCTINGLVTNGQYSGLFGYVNNAHIENLTVNVSNDSGNTSAGGLVGVVNGTTTITNCNVLGTVKGTHQIGGFVGFAQDCVLTISNGNNSATITTIGQSSNDKGRTSGGGIVGYVNDNATVTINDVTNTGAVKTESSSANSGLGGIVGFANGKTIINNCNNTASITGYAGLGGIVGYTANGSIVGCRNDGNITSSKAYNLGADSASYSGGIAGYCYADVAKCYNSGTVKTTSDWANSNIVGGIVGYLGEGRNVKYCYNGGWIEGSDYVGGIVGKRAGTVSYSYQAGTIKGLYKKTSTIGHITGNDTSEISTCWTLPSASNATTVTNTFNHNGYTVNSEANVAMKPAFGNAVLNGWNAIISTGATSGTFSEITGIDQFVFYPNNIEHEIENNEYLFVYDTSANAVALVPNHIDSGVEAINGSTTASVAKTVPFVSRFYFNASSDKNLVASISPIDAPLTSTQTVYNGSGQKVTTDVVGADIQEKSYYFTSGNDNALAKSEFIDAGEYDIVTEVTMKVGENTYVVVGRQVHETKWTIKTRKIRFWNKIYYYGDTPTNAPVPQSMSGDEGLLKGHIFTCTYANDLTYDFMYGAIPNAKKEVTINMTGEIRDAAGNDVTYNYDFQNGTFTISMREGNFGVKGTTDIVNNPWGSQGNPFVIKTAQHLVNLSKIVNGETPYNADTTQIVNSIYNNNQYKHVVNNNTRTYKNCYFIIVNDIDMTGINFAPVGKSETYFFEGNISGVTSIEDTSQQNRFISNLTVNLASTDNVGLFGYVRKTGTEKPYIKHIVLNNSCSFVGKSNVGSIAGWAQDAIIQNCINNATVEGKGENAGGIVGKNFGTETSNCENHGTVKGVKNVGGIAGTLDWGVISNVQNAAMVEASGENCGGIVGYMISYSTLKDVTNNAQVNGNHKTGGVLGYYVKITVHSVKPIYNLTNTKPVVGASNVGGIIGCVAGDLTFDGNNENQKCTMSGVSVKGTFNVGGLVGGVENNSTVTLKNFTNNANVIGGYVVGGLVGLLRGAITSSVNNADITSEYNKAGTPSGLSNGAYVGGIVGVAYGTISHCYNSGNISASGDNSDFLGGIVGYTNSNVSYCTSLANSSISGSNQVGGIAGKLQNATIDHCYFNGTIVGIWNNSGAKLDFICGEITDGSVSNSWKLPNAQNGDTGNRTYTNAGNALTIATGMTFKPYFIQEGSEHDTEWEQIVSKDIVGFSVSGNVPTNSYFNSDNGNDTAYVKPDKANGFAANSTSGNVTAWYGADFGSDVRCSIVEIQIDTTADEYNGNVQGLTREDVHMPSANNGVYAVQFAYKGNKYGDVIPEDVDVYNTTVTVKIDEKVVGVRTGVRYEITKKKVTITNIWTWKYVNGSNADFYKFEYNKDIQGMLSITVDGVLKNSHYTLTQANNQAAAEKYSSSVVISDRDYEVEIVSKYCTIQNNNANLETDNAKYGIKTTQTNANMPNSQTTYTYNWEIVPFDLAANISNVWFGGTMKLIVGNQGIANVEGDTTKSYYPLQADKKGTGVQQVLVYAQHNYAAGNFVLYVKYNNGIVAELKQGTDKEYTVGTLDTSNNTVGTFDENVVSQTNPVQDTNVTASGTGNFSGIITKYYTALFSDFGGNVTGANWGSADNPYVISTPEHLLRLSQIVNGGMAWNSIITTNNALCISPQGTAVAKDRAYSGAYFLVTADIDMTGNVSTDGVYNFLPIGHRNEQSQTDMPFSGTFDGNGKIIKFVYNVNRNNFYNNNKAHSDYVGLFGYIAGYKVDAEQKYATIKNLSIESMDGNEVDDNGGIIGKDYVGGIAGYAVDSKLYNVSVMYGGWLRGENYVGGIVGYAENTWLEIEKNYGNAITNANVGGIQYVGGIVGKWIVRSEEQIGGDAAGQARITPASGQQIHGVKYVGGLVGWLDTSSCTSKVEYTPQLNNNGEKVGVTGTEYVGALFGALIGNGYHKGVKPEPQTGAIYTAIGIDSGKVNNITLGTRYSDGDVTYQSKVVGGLVGYVESAGFVFVSDWNTANIAFDLQNVQDAALSFFGGLVGVLGQNATMEALYEIKTDGTYLFGGSRTITNDTTFGASNPLGSFVGGIVGYVSSQAGTYWDSTTTIFGNGIALVNSANIYATGYVGGIFGALGDISENVAQTFENDTNSILYKVLTTGVRSGNANTTLGIAPATKSEWVDTAVGKLHNTAGVSATNNYVGGIAGYSGAKVRFVLRNAPQNGAVNLNNLNVYSAGANVAIYGSYAGGIAGYLADNLEHELQYIVVQAKFDSVNAKRVGGLVGYMGSGKVERCIVTSPDGTSPDGTISATTDNGNYQGAEYVGGLVGETQNAIIRNSVSTGFNLDKTTNTKGGLLGGGTNPTIESSWTFYIANSGATYQTVSKNTYGKYILVDTDIVTINGSSYPTFENLCGFAGIASKQGVTKGVLEFAVRVPSATDNDTLKNKQLAFYNASGSDVETSNKDSFKGFENRNNVLTIKLDMASGTSMQICLLSVRFVNVPKCSATSTEQDKIDIVEATYVKPSNSTRYHIGETTADFDTTGTSPTYQVTHIVANVFFDYNGDMVYIGTAESSEKTGSYDSGPLTPGTETNPYTISSQKEWDEFAYSVYDGNQYIDKFIKLLANVTVTGGHTNFANNGGYNFAGDVSKDSDTNNFHGTFDGNGCKITISFEGVKMNRVSVFPNAAGATFKNLTIDGVIISNTAANDSDYTGKWNAGYDVASFVGKPFEWVAFYNCTNLAKVSGLRNAGGFVGYTNYTVTAEACVNKGDIYSSEGINKSSVNEYGWVAQEIETDDGSDGYKYANVTLGTGGIIGNSNLAQTIESCMNTGYISGGHNVGGIIGRANGDLTIKNCANVGDIVAHSGAEKYGGEDTEEARYLILSYVGGIVGKTSRLGTIDMDASYNTGVVTAWGSISGGLIGSVGNYVFGNANISASDATKHKDGALAKISRCYNTGLVQSGGTYAKESWRWTFGRLEVNGQVSGGIVGSLAHSEISYCYNLGEVITHSLIGGKGTWQARVGGIAGQVLPNKNSSEYVKFNNCYNVGYITLETAGTNFTSAEPRYGASISGYCDNSDSAQRVSQTNSFGLAYNVRYRNTRQKKEYIYNEYNKYNTGTGWSESFMVWGSTINSLADFSAVMNDDGSVRPEGSFGETHIANAKSLEGYVYMPGCLPQLAVFAVDTYNGLSMKSIVYGNNDYGDYDKLKAGGKQNPYIIKDGIDMLGMQALLDAGYNFDNQYIEFANGSNNITLDKQDASVVSKEIEFPTYTSTSTKLSDDTTAYKSKGSNGGFSQTGKSYQLFAKGAICGTSLIVAAQKDLTIKVPSTDGGATMDSISTEYDKTEDVNDAYKAWLYKAHYYNGEYNDSAYGEMRRYSILGIQNYIVAREQAKAFKGNLSGRQANGTKNTIINNLRITAGNVADGAYAGLFGIVEDAYIGYIEIGGSSRINAYSYNNTDTAAVGAITGNMLGNSVIEHCGVSGTTSLGAYGQKDNIPISSNITYAGGIVGIANTSQSGTYNAGVEAAIKSSTVNITLSTSYGAAGIIQACKSNIGGVLGYVGGDAGANGKGNSVRIEGCEVQKAAIQAASSATESSHIGGVLGYGSEYVAAFITGCEVGNGADTVTIKGEHSLGGIAGGMSNAKGGYIDSCIVGEKATIERINQGGGNISENPKQGTAIGGLVGFTEDSTDTTSPLTTTFSGTSKFLGTINVTVGTTNPGEHGDKKPVGNVGGIVGDMGSGANFASGSDVTVDGTINITLAAANVGGVAGRTNTATFIGKFNVSPNMTTPLTENVGGFIGKNVGTVYILADTTDKLENTTVGALNGTSISIGGKIKGTSEVGGFIGVNNSGSTLNIGSNVANAKPYKSGTLSITIAEGAEISGSGNHVGGIVGKNEGAVDAAQNDYATIDIVKGTIVQNGTISGKNYVGGIIGLNAGLLTTGGGEADTSIGGIALSDDQIGLIKNLSITNGNVKGDTTENNQDVGNVKGGVTENNQYVGGDCVGGVIGWLDAPQDLRDEHKGKGDIAGVFTNSGSVEGNRFVGGSLGYVGKYVTIATKGGVNTLFVNTGNVTAHSTFAGGSIGAIVGKITGANIDTTVNFENTGEVKGSGYVGGSIGVLAGQTQFAQFVNSSKKDFTIDACNSVGGSVGYIGMPDALKTILNTYFNDNTYSNGDITVKNVHFEASGKLTANPSDATLAAAKDDGKGGVVDDNDWGGVGGAIGVLGRNQLATWENNTYYANGNVIAQSVNNVGGIVGLINANDITIGNLLAYNIIVTGAKNVGGIVGATNGTNTKILSAYTIEGTFSGTENVGGIIGLAKTDTDASTSYWVKGYANSDIATYDVKDLSKLGFTTGKATTGWFFLYANDATGANGLGIINTNHQGGGENELKYWKRIANAYTAQERADGDDKKTIAPPSDIVSGGQPQHATLYATATAAEVTEKGYYMYTATSNNDVKPSVIYDNGVYYISVKTNVINAEDEKVQAQNVAVFYRSVSSSKEALIYNGYLRNAIIGLDGVDLYENPIGDNETPTINGYKGQYIFTATTTIKNADGSTSEVNEAQSDPNTYSSVIKIYYVDDNGTARLVGGNTELAWKITERELTVKFEKVTNRVYGTGADNSTDMTITISNIAPNRGKSVPIKITVAVDKEDIVVYTWNGTSFTGSNVGVKLAYLLEPNGTLSDEDKSSTSENITDENTYQLVARLFFTEAKSYTITVSDGSSGNTKARYVFKVNEGSAATEVSDNFTVIPAELRLVSSYATSSAYDGTYKDKEWLVTGFKYNDGILQFAEFGPSFNIKYKNGDVTTKAMTADNMTTGVDFNGPRVSVAGPSNGNLIISLANAINKGEYYLTFGKIAAGNYTLKIEDYLFSIVEIQIEISCDDNGKSKIYDGNAKDVKFTFKASAPAGVTFDGISEYKTFISKFFKINNQTIETNSLKLVDNKTITLTLQTEKDAATYKFVFGKGEKYDDHIKNCALKPATLPTYTYTITKRSITLSTTPTSTKTYIYNTEHQGLSQVKLNGESGDVGIVSGDTVMVKVSVPGGDPSSKTLSFDNQTLEVTAGISTIDANQYVASFDLDDASSKKNYTLSATNVSWKIDKYKIMIGEFEIGAEKTYNAEAEVPKINVTNSEVSGNGTTFNYGTDTFTLEYAVSYNNQTYASNNLVNAGTYKIKIGTSNGKIHAKHSDGNDASNNYEFGNSSTEHQYVINPCEIKIGWEKKTFVYNASNWKLNVASIEINNKTKTVTNNRVQTGLGNDTLTFSRGGGGIDVGSYTTEVTSHSVSVSVEPIHGVRPIAGNYKIVSGATSDTFNIIPSKLKIVYSSGTTSKVYDATTTVKDNNFTFTVSSTNFGANGTSELFDISYVYKDKNVGNDKEVVFTYVLKQNANYEYVGTGTESQNKGQITPAHIKVALDKLRSGKATRTFTNEPYYGGKDGASGGKNDGKSTVYRSGEGFRISGVFGNDDIKVVAKYAEAGDDRAMFDKYVNDIVKIDENTFAKAAAGTHLKMLVFEMTGGDATNYTFNVYDTSDKAYSKNNGDSQTPVNVYDKDDEKNNKDKLSQIKIEITVKTYKVEYTNAAQSYANADNTYNTNWERVGVSNNPPGVTVTVSNGWMFADGQDHGDDEQAEKKVYKAYTTIRGSQNSVRLGAKISGIDGMELNYKMVNQPILTIGYFVVDNNDVFEIGSASSLMIASYYWWVAQNGQNPDFNLPLVATSTWHKIVSNDDYMTKPFEKPSDAPNDVDMTGWDWDMYFAWFEQQNDVKIFLNETGISNEDGTWGYYTTGEESQQTQYTKYRMVRDFSGKLSESDIAILEAFFPKEKGWGVGKTYLDNFLNTSVGSVLTAVGSVFRWYNGSVGQFEFDGNGYVIEYLNIMGYDKENIGLFDVIGANGIVKNLHLRNITINANQGNVGGIAGSIAAAEGDADATKNVTNVSFHGKITATGGTVGGLFGTSARAIDGAIVLGEISATNANVGGVVGTATADLTKVVSMMQITASGGTVGAFTSNNANVGEYCTHMTNAVWQRGTGFVNVVGKNVDYNALMSGSNSLYANGTSDLGTYDVISETFADSGQNVNPRQSKRLRDMVSVYLLMYSLSVNNGTYTISSSSWLVGTADGTDNNKIVIANKQNVSLLRELRFAAFVLKANVSIDIASTFSGAFYGSVTSETDKNYKIICNKQMFEAYATTTQAWLVTPTQP